MERLYWLWLCALTRFSPMKKQRLLTFFKTPEDVFKASRHQLARAPFLRTEDVDYILDVPLDLAKKAEHFIAKHRIDFITQQDALYPDGLRELEDAPVALFAKGNVKLLENPYKFGIVGSRKASASGRRQAEYFAAALAINDVTVVSGLAAGIDGAAHAGAIRYPGSTIGVTATGINVLYPKRHYELYKQMFRDGLVLTEQFLDQEARPYFFPMRNRLITGLSRGLLVVEAAEKSGALTSAEHALNQGKDVYAIPKDLGFEQGRGVNALIKDGAFLTTSPNDILEHLIPGFVAKEETTERKGEAAEKTTPRAKQPPPAVRGLPNKAYDPEKEKVLNDENKMLLGLIREGFDTMDKLLEKTQLGITVLNSNISELELEDIIRIEFGKIYLN